MSDRIRLAVWGVGHHAIKNILPALAQSRSVQLVGVCSRNADVVAKMAAAYDCRGWTTPADMLSSPDVDVVYATTPTGLHAANGRDVLQAGKHFWCDKPITCVEDEASWLVRESRSRRLSIAEGFMYLYHPQWARLRDVARSGTLGRLRTIKCRFEIPPLTRQSFRNDPALGGSAFLDVGSYTLSIVSELLPNEDPVIENAEIAKAYGSAVDTSGRAVLRYADGLRAVLDWRTDRTYANGIELDGSDGSLSVEYVFSKAADHVPEFRFVDRNGAEKTEAGVPANHFVAMFDAFRKLADNPDAAEAERAAIQRRAKLAARVRAAAESQRSE